MSRTVSLSYIEYPDVPSLATTFFHDDKHVLAFTIDCLLIAYNSQCNHPLTIMESFDIQTIKHSDDHTGLPMPFIGNHLGYLCSYAMSCNYCPMYGQWSSVDNTRILDTCHDPKSYRRNIFINQYTPAKAILDDLIMAYSNLTDDIPHRYLMLR